MTNASDLSSRQLALVMAACLKYVAAADLLATGGDAEAFMQSGIVFNSGMLDGYM